MRGYTNYRMELEDFDISGYIYEEPGYSEFEFTAIENTRTYKDVTIEHVCKALDMTEDEIIDQLIHGNNEEIEDCYDY